MKRILCLLLILFLTAGLMGGALGEKALEGRPFVNPELPGNLPGECPAPEEDYYLHVNYEHNPHPAPYLRGDWFFPRMDEFYAAYPQVKEGCGMYVPPEDRLSLW